MLRSLSTLRRPVPRQLQVGAAGCFSEFDTPTDFITHCPSLAERFPFHIDAFLYHSPPSPNDAVKCHQEYRDLISNVTGARVWTVREILGQIPTSELRSLVIDSSEVRFRIEPDCKADAELMKREYMDKSLSNLGKDALIDLLMLHPMLTINVDNSSTGFSVTEIPVRPLSNFVFTRDQQIVGPKGVVIGRFAAPQRSYENSLMERVWRQLGVKPLTDDENARMNKQCVLEGGDFFALGPELAVIGVGLRTNWSAVRWLLDADMIGTTRVVVVEDVNDRSVQRSHLDTVFCPLDESMCMCLDKVAQDHYRFRRTAHVFVKDDGRYVEEYSCPFGQWLRHIGLTVVVVSVEQQKQYYLNNLHLGKDTYQKSYLLATNEEVKKLLERAGFNGEVYAMNMAPITSMYGGAHSASSVLRRRS